MAAATKTPVQLNARQEALLAIILKDNNEYHRRQQHHYLLNGQSTSHIVVHAIQDFTTLKLFWPKDLVTEDGTHRLYGLKDDTLYKVQNAVRDTLKQLEAKGLIEKLGNEHERRWRPVR